MQPIEILEPPAQVSRGRHVGGPVTNAPAVADHVFRLHTDRTPG